MNLEPNPFQTEIADGARRFLADRLPIAHIRALGGGAGRAMPDEDWAACAEMGWLALLAPDDAGGLGLGMAEAALVIREIGRHLTPGPFIPTMLAALVAAASGDEQLARSLGEGRMRAGLAMGDLAVDVHEGDLVLASDATGATLCNVSAIDPVYSADPGTRLGRVRASAPVATIDDPLMISRARILVAAQLLGVVEAVRDMSAAYAQLRVQFGKPIGTFQAVKHRCADMSIAAYALRAQLFMAAVRLDAGMADASFHAASAHVIAVNAGRRSTADNIQNHGGIGMTWEHDAHLYLKRSLLLEKLLGPLRESFRAIMVPERHSFY